MNNTSLAQRISGGDEQPDFPTLLVKIQTLFERADHHFSRRYSLPVTQIEWLDNLLLGELFAQISAKNEPLPAGFTQAMLIERLNSDYQAALAVKKSPFDIAHIHGDYLGQRNHIASFALRGVTDTGLRQYKTRLINVDTQQKTLIRIQDLIPAPHQAAVIALLWESYQQDRLDEHGDYDGKVEKSAIYLPEDFRFTPEGIGFVYPATELGAYAEGEIELLLDWEMLQPLIHPAYYW